MIRKSLLTLCVGVLLWACSGKEVTDQQLNQFCESDGNCAPGLTCMPNLKDVCVSTNDTCSMTTSGSACCDTAHLCAAPAGVCCQESCVLIVGTSASICPSAGAAKGVAGTTL
jgi:hypothetical protein